MDEGTAAFYAAFIGFAAAVIGAAVGGWASWKAARHGADAAVRAAVEQVNGQAVNEHAHWVRQERRLAYGEVLRAFTSLCAALSKCQGNMVAGIPFMNELRDLSEKATVFSFAVVAVHMLGPREVSEAVMLLGQEVENVRKLNTAWARALLSFATRSDELLEEGSGDEGESEELDALFEAVGQARELAVNAEATLLVGYDAFVRASRSVLLARS